MKIKTVSYQKVFPLGQFINERIGVECEINEMENPATILQEAKLMVEKFHKDSNPQLYDVTKMGTEEEIPEVKTDPKETQIKNFIEAISTTTTIKSLEIFQKLVDRENNPALTNIYNQRLKELQSWIGAK